MNNAMTKEEYLALASSEWEHLEELEKEVEFYNYEKKLETIFLELGRKYLESRVNNKGNDRRKKKR